MFTFLIKLAATVILSLMAAKSAARSKKDVTAGKKKFDRGAFLTILAIGGTCGLIMMVFPPVWMIQVLFIVTYIALQLVNEEGKYRATCWGLLSLLSGIMLVLGMAAWQDEIGGIRPWMVVVGIIFSTIPIFIGIYKGTTLEYFEKNKKSNETGEKIVAFATQNKKILAGTVFVFVCVVSLITAVVWAFS